MTQLVKAQLCELSGSTGSNRLGKPIDVQFNPTTLRVAISNKTAGGQQAGSQVRQRPGTGEIQVSFDLVFDTADEGKTGSPIPVTRKTQIVENFVRPRGNTPAQQTPPRVQFTWGSFVVEGVMESANIDLDLFAANGTPLRAKVSVSIKGQEPNYRYEQAQPAAGTQSSGASGSQPAGAPGTLGGTGAPTSLAQAMPGESLQQLAARNGLDPAAWRALAAGISNPLSLAAGIEVAVPGSLRAGGSLSGQRTGANDADLTARLPLVNPAVLPATPAASAQRPAATSTAKLDPVRAGQAIARQGGVAGAIAGVRADAQRSAVAATFGAFGIGPFDGPTAAAPQDATTLTRPYGSGAPLRPLRGSRGGTAPTTPDPTRPGWEALPPRPTAGIRRLGRLRPVDPCGCGCGGKGG